MAVLILKNVASEGPGTMGEYLASRSIESTTVDLLNGWDVSSIKGYDTLVVLGGPMSVYEYNDYPAQRAGLKCVELALGHGMRVLGICLGAQVLAQALGARVYKGHVEETGWMDIKATAEGAVDVAMRKLFNSAGRARVFHWHSDTFDIPIGAVRLAGSGLYPNQAFRYGDNAYALQFHIEVTPEIVAGWFKGKPGVQSMVNEARKIDSVYRAAAEGFYGEFFA